MKSRTAFVLSVSTIAFGAQAQVALSDSSQTYKQDFNSLTTNASAAQDWSNNVTLPGWSLFDAKGAELGSYFADNGGNTSPSATTGSFRSYGSTGATDRAFGGLASGGTYFGSPASGSIAGYLALSLANQTGGTLDSLSLSYTGEQWRNNGNASAQTLLLQYAFGASFSSIASWNDAGSSFGFTSLVNSSTASALDGNAAANRSVGLGGTLSDLNWMNGDTLWIRWVYRNNTGNDHGLAIDDLSLSVAPVTAVPEPSQYALLLAGLAAVSMLVRRRSCDDSRV